MDIRVLRYFLAIVHEGTMSSAARVLHVTQPTLSRQISELERELGKTLLIRGGRQVELTEDGALLFDSAEEIVELADRTLERLASPAVEIGGEVYIGCGESESTRAVIRAAKSLRDAYPKVTFQITSGNSYDLEDRLDKGLFDFAVLQERVDAEKYESMELPGASRWGVLVRSDHPLSEMEKVAPADLESVPLICSKQALGEGLIEAWADSCYERYEFAGTYNLVFNGTLMVEEGLGCMLCYDDLVNVRGTDLRFRPLDPPLSSVGYLVWRRGKHFTKAAAAFLELLREETA